MYFSTAFSSPAMYNIQENEYVRSDYFDKRI